MGKIVYITAMTPFSSGETFVLTEMCALKDAGMDICIIPRNVSKELFNEKARSLLNDTLGVALFDRGVIKELLKYLVRHSISLVEIMSDIALNARNIKIALKNLAVLPKGIYLSKVLEKLAVAHIHAHWASTTATMAYIVYKITGIPWSFTAHRWDIAENNILKKKCKTAFFVRAIDENGRKEIVEIIKDSDSAKKIKVIHMGVDIPEHIRSALPVSDVFTFLCPANLVEVKGHKYLFEACQILSRKGITFKCLVAGDGPLENELKECVRNLQLDHCIDFLGRLPHEGILDLYKNGIINVVVLPSIVTKDGEKEGIPVSLVEAMAYGIPVISTNTGGIPELIGDGGGIMVAQKDPQAIATAIEDLMGNTRYYRFQTQCGREKVEKEFNISLISKSLLDSFLNQRI